MADALKEDLEKRMTGAMNALENSLGGLRTGRASPALLEPVMAEAYGDRMPLSQLATVSVPESRLITVQVWDASLVKTVEKAITNANLGVNPVAEGQLIRVPVPALSEERRKELVKLAHKYGEDAKISVRNVRRDGMDTLKKQEKDNEISQDEQHTLNDEVQKLTDRFIQKIDELVSQKEKDIMQV